MCIPHLFGAINPTYLLKWMCWLMVHGAYLFIKGNRLGKMDQAQPLCSVTVSKEPWVLIRNMSFFSFPGQFAIYYVPYDSNLVVFSSASCWSSGNAGHLNSCSGHRQVGGALVRRLHNYSFCQPKSFWGNSEVGPQEGPVAKWTATRWQQKVISSCISHEGLLVLPSFKMLDYGCHGTGWQASL